MGNSKNRSFAIEPQLSELLTSAALGEGVQPGKLVNRALREYLIAKPEKVLPKSEKKHEDKMVSSRKNVHVSLDPRLIGEKIFSNPELQQMRREGTLILSYGKTEVPESLSDYEVAIIDINVNNPSKN